MSFNTTQHNTSYNVFSETHISEYCCRPPSWLYRKQRFPLKNVLRAEMFDARPLNETAGSSWIWIGSSGLDVFWHRAFQETQNVIVVPRLILYMFGLNFLYAKLVSRMAAHAAFRRTPPSLFHHVQYKRHMPADMFCWHGAVVMATQQGHWVCVYSQCVCERRTGARWWLKSSLSYLF